MRLHCWIPGRTWSEAPHCTWSGSHGVPHVCSGSIVGRRSRTSRLAIHRPIAADHIRTAAGHTAKLPGLSHEAQMRGGTCRQANLLRRTAIAVRRAGIARTANTSLREIVEPRPSHAWRRTFAASGAMLGPAARSLDRRSEPCLSRPRKSEAKPVHGPYGRHM